MIAAALRRTACRLSNWANRSRLEARLSDWCPPASLISANPAPVPRAPLSSERALGNLNAAWQQLHRAVHRDVAPGEREACQREHRAALDAYIRAAHREFGQ